MGDPHIWSKQLQRAWAKCHDAAPVRSLEESLDRATARTVRAALGGLFTPEWISTPYGDMHAYRRRSFATPRDHAAPTDAESSPTVVLIHGVGSSAQSLLLLAASLPPHWQVVLPDLFHFAGFSRPTGPALSLQQHVESVIWFLRQWPHSPQAPFRLCGLSLGGWIAQWVALKAPELVSSLVLLNSAGLHLGVRTLEQSLLFMSWQRFKPLYRSIFFAFPYRGLPLFEHIACRALYRNLRSEAVRSFVKAVQEDDFLDDKLDRIKQSTLLLWGERDRFLSPQMPGAFLAGLPAAKGYGVHGCGHIPCLESPITIARAMADFYGASFHKEPWMHVFPEHALSPLVPGGALGQSQTTGP